MHAVCASSAASSARGPARRGAGTPERAARGVGAHQQGLGRLAPLPVRAGAPARRELAPVALEHLSRGQRRRRGQAEVLHETAKGRLEERARRDAQERAEELARAQRNQARAADFQLAGAYAFSVKKELDQLGREENKAQKQAQDARLREQQSRTHLHHRDAEAKLVTRHREAIDAEEAAKRERAAEEEAAEVHNARRRHS